MSRWEADVFIEMECLHQTPIDPWSAGQRVQKLLL